MSDQDAIKMSRDQYDALTKWAQTGAITKGEQASFFLIQKQIDALNEVKRYTLAVRWTPLAERPTGPNGITPAVVISIGEFSRPPTPEDVPFLLANEQYDLRSVQVSADPNGVLGFYELDKYPWG
jgi:hypothetical protein